MMRMQFSTIQGKHEKRWDLWTSDLPYLDSILCLDYISLEIGSLDDEYKELEAFVNITLINLIIFRIETTQYVLSLVSLIKKDFPAHLTCTGFHITMSYVIAADRLASFFWYDEASWKMCGRIESRMQNQIKKLVSAQINKKHCLYLPISGLVLVAVPLGFGILKY